MVISGAVPAEVGVASTAFAGALGVRAGVTAGSVVGSNIYYSGRGSEKPAGGETLQKDRNEKTSNKADINTLYHYTNEKGLNGILESNELRPSLKANNPKDARYGDGQYLSDVIPETTKPASLSAKFIRTPNKYKYTHFVEIDVAGLDVVKGRNGVYVILNDQNLDIAG